MIFGLILDVSDRTDEMFKKKNIKKKHSLVMIMNVNVCMYCTFY